MQGTENLTEEMMTENFPNGEEKRHTSPGSSESHKKFGPKEAYTRVFADLHSTYKQTERGSQNGEKKKQA